MNSYFYLKKTTSFIFNYIFIPLTLFIILSPVTYSSIYYFENRLPGSITRLVKIDNKDINSNITLNYANIKKTEANIILNQLSYRSVVLDKFFAIYNSPLAGYGEKFVEACDKYDAPKDCTTLAAIAFVETKLCTLALSDKQKNCWGWGGSPPNRIIFPSYEASIDRITRGLVEGYGVDRMEDPKLMQFRYCGAHCDKWGGAVQNIRNQINQLAIDLGYPRLF